MWKRVFRRPAGGWKRYLARHGTASLAFYLFVLAGLWFLQGRLIYPGAFMTPREHFSTNYYAAVLKSETIPVDGGSLFSLHAVPASGKPVVVMFHGNAGFPEDYAVMHGALLAKGFGIVAPALRGYPRSSGKPSEEAILSDAIDIVDWIDDRYPTSPIVAFGQSLGTAPAIAAAGSDKVDGLVLMSPFLSMRALVFGKLPFVPVGLLLNSQFRNDQAIARVKVPILVFHGTEDPVIPIRSGQALSLLAESPVEFFVVEGAGHNDGMLTDDVADRLTGFVARQAR